MFPGGRAGAWDFVFRRASTVDGAESLFLGSGGRARPTGSGAIVPRWARAPAGVYVYPYVLRSACTPDGAGGGAIFPGRPPGSGVFVRQRAYVPDRAHHEIFSVTVY